MTAFLAIRDAVRAELQGIPALVSGRVSTDPGEVLSADDLDDITVELQGAQGERNFAGRQPIDWQTEVQVTCRARSYAGQDAMTRADQILGLAWARILAMPYPPGAFDLELQQVLDFQSDPGETAAAAISFVVRVTHRTQAGSLDGVI